MTTHEKQLQIAASLNPIKESLHNLKTEIKVGNVKLERVINYIDKQERQSN